MQFNFDNTYITLSSEIYTKCKPTPVISPQLIAFNHSLATELGISYEANDTELMAKILSGNVLPESAASIAQAYSGHQFGHFTKLGDGRTILLGEQLTPSGQRFDIQYKGSGITPYSRRGDGRATLSAMLREYIISEAMHALNIPTSRSLAVVATGESVNREKLEPGAVLTRIAASHIRVGTYEHIRNFCSTQTFFDFNNYVVKRHFPELLETENPALSILEKVIDLQTDLIVNWMRVGFIHGVMNTDNMAISGETIDYGPCAFINAYKPDTVFSSIDINGRYAFVNQANIGLWNITRLAESLLYLIDDDMKIAIKKAEEKLMSYQVIYERKYTKMLGNKIGLEEVNAEDVDLINRLLTWMELNAVDYTNTFVKLLYPDIIQDEIYNQSYFVNWKNEWEERIISITNWRNLMKNTNPIYIPRNHIVEKVLKEVTETGKTNSLDAFMEHLSKPYNVINPDLNYLIPPSEEDDENYKTFCGT